jgi:signal recognition particle subunit SRP54
MFNQLTEKLTNSVNKLRGKGRLTEDNIKKALKDIRVALLDADVALPVIKILIAQIRQKALGENIAKKVRPGEAFIKIVQQELTEILGANPEPLYLDKTTPTVILMAGLQGSGKTTTAGKLAKHLIEKKDKTVAMVSADIYRPAAIEQLQTLCEQVGAQWIPSTPQEKPTAITANALAQCKKQFIDVLIIDTAGRLHIDEELMEELKDIHSKAKPVETLLVVDSLSGQDAANVAKNFHEALELTGVILTKTDGDARGGAALSMRVITEKSIKFVGVGEKIDDLEEFNPERVAKSILGMSHIVDLVEQAEQKIDKEKAKKMAKKVQRGKGFNFNDLLDVFSQKKKMGNISQLLGKMPGGMAKMAQDPMGIMSDDKTKQMEAIIQSMTPQERLFPAIMNGSRKRRLAGGSGTDLQAVNKLIKTLTQIEKTMKQFKGDKMQKRLRHMQNQLPPGALDKLGPMGEDGLK